MKLLFPLSCLSENDFQPEKVLDLDKYFDHVIIFLYYTIWQVSLIDFRC